MHFLITFLVCVTLKRGSNITHSLVESLTNTFVPNNSKSSRDKANQEHEESNANH